MERYTRRDSAPVRITSFSTPLHSHPASLLNQTRAHTRNSQIRRWAHTRAHILALFWACLRLPALANGVIVSYRNHKVKDVFSGGYEYPQTQIAKVDVASSNLVSRSSKPA